MTTWINGISDAQRASTELAADDRGLSYGDGLFETMRLESGVVHHLNRHLARLAEGCARLAMDRVNFDVVRREIEAATRTALNGVLKLVLTRGPGPRGYRPTGEERPTRIISSTAPGVVNASAASVGVRVCFCRTPATENAALAGLKHLNRLDCVLARSEWSDPEIAEGLMRDSRGSVVGGTMSNVFAVRGRTLVTPGLGRCGVRGIMRGVVIDAALTAGIAVAEQELSAAELDAAQEVFLTNALIGVWPVRAIEERKFAVGSITRLLQHSLA